MRNSVVAVASILLYLIAQQSFALTAPIQERVASSEQLQKLGGFRDLDPNCKPTNNLQISLISPPNNGRVTTEKGADFPNYPINHPRSKCKSRKVPSTILFYQSAAGFVGDDNFAVEIVNENGAPLVLRFHVSVRQ